MRGRRTAALAGIAAAYVFLSSWFGLNGAPILQGNLGGRVDFFVSVWSDSLLADAVFVAGTIAAGLATLRLAQRLHPLAGFVGGAVSHWLVYLASYLLLGEVSNQQVEGLWDSAAFVAQWGWVGLLVAATLPIVAAWWVHERGSIGPLDERVVGSS